MDLQISEIDPALGYTAIGSGCPFALGSLYTTAKTKQSPMTRLRTALDAASEFSKGCGKPFEIYSYDEAIKTLGPKKYTKKRKTRTKK
jgi:ATP-dependent protease HslVU (ClpYQ) peptidase subunit